MPAVNLQALGCRLNEAELEAWAREFAVRGFRTVTQPEQADLIVVNTCAVTAEAARKSRNLLRRAHRRNPRAKLVVSGCHATLDPPGTRAIDGVDLLVPNTGKDALVETVLRELALETMPASAATPGASALFRRGRQRAFVKVQDGCRYRCSFCVVTLARGRERSRPIHDVVAEIDALVAGGVKEVVLTGVHIGGYGADLGTDLAGLIAAILERTALPRLRLASLEPWDLPDGFFALFADRRLMPHLHLPLQSGSDTVLKRMVRRCNTAAYARLVERARREVTDFNVTTDVIVGFPGETEAEWTQSLRFIEDIGFSHVHIFPYSPRAGTRAAGLPDPVPAAVRATRSRELHELAAVMRRRCQRAHCGRTLPVLWEARSGARGGPEYAGYTPNFLRAVLRRAPAQDVGNCIRAARLVDTTPAGDALLAELS